MDTHSPLAQLRRRLSLSAALATVGSAAAFRRGSRRRRHHGWVRRALPLVPLAVAPAAALVGAGLWRRSRVATAAGDAAADVEPLRVRDRDRFFRDADFDYAFQLILGSCYRRGADAGEAFATALQIRDGHPDSWFEAWTGLARQLQASAEAAAARGHLVSAREAYLRAATAFATALYLVDSTHEPSRMLPTWKQHRACWERFVDLLPNVERIEIPYEQGRRLPGYFFKVDERSAERRPLVILNNGSDGATSALWLWGGAAALERGYNALVFDGPGQQASLFLGEMGFRPDWEVVITAVVDYALSRSDVEPGRIALAGWSQAGYWVPRAVAFEHRIAAAVVDPGVMDVSASWTSHLPDFMKRELERNERDAFNRSIGFAMRTSRALRGQLEFRMRPYRLETPFDAFQAVRGYNLRGIAERITCPMLILDPEGEQFWPGQSQQLHDAVAGPKTLVRFTREDGADMHCEPRAQAAREQRIFDWLDETMQ